MCDGRGEGGGVSQLETDVLASSKHRAPGNTTQHKHRHAQIRCAAAAAAYAAEHCESSDLYAGWGKRVYSGALTLRLTCQSQSPGDLSFSLSACSSSWFRPLGWLNDRAARATFPASSALSQSI